MENISGGIYGGYDKSFTHDKLTKQQQFGVADQDSCDSNSLFLTTG
jgi:hypothetical protein